MPTTPAPPQSLYDIFIGSFSVAQLALIAIVVALSHVPWRRLVNGGVAFAHNQLNRPRRPGVGDVLTQLEALRADVAAIKAQMGAPAPLSPSGSP